MPGLVPPRLALPALPGFLRRPLAWVIAAESVVTAAFLVAAVHLLSASLPVVPAGAPLVTVASPAAGLPPPDVGRLLPSPSAGGPTRRPGLGQSPAFLGTLMSGLNSDQATFEHQEWSALQALSSAIRAYIENVVVPAVERAAHGGAARSGSP